MRYTLFIALLFITFTACKKDYACDCVVTNTLTMGPKPDTIHTSTGIRKANTPAAQQACTEYQSALDNQSGEYTTVECVLK